MISSLFRIRKFKESMCWLFFKYFIAIATDLFLCILAVSLCFLLDKYKRLFRHFVINSRHLLSPLDSNDDQFNTSTKKTYSRDMGYSGCQSNRFRRSHSFGLFWKISKESRELCIVQRCSVKFVESKFFLSFRHYSFASLYTKTRNFCRLILSRDIQVFGRTEIVLLPYSKRPYRVSAKMIIANNWNWFGPKLVNRINDETFHVKHSM